VESRAVTTAASEVRLAGIRERAAAVPAWGWLTLVYLVSVGFRFALSLRVPAPWVFQDEIVYADLGRSLGETGHFAIRDAPGANGFGPLYPALIAPAWALFGTSSTAYAVAKLINALVMSLAVVPTYLIARRLMRPSLALVAGVFAVAIPSLAYTNTLLSENAFYPAVMAAAAALFLLLERPTLLRVGLLFLFTVVAFLVRAQAVTLVPALVGSIVLVALANVWSGWWPRPRALGRELLRYRVPLVAVAVAVGGVSLYETARGRPVKAILGGYSGITNLHHPLLPTIRWTLHHFGELDLYLGVIPFLAMIIIVTLGLRPRERSPELRAFAAAAVALVLVFVITAGVYATDWHGNRIEERYMFHVAPLFFVALLAWVERGLPRPVGLAGTAAAAAAGFAALVPYDQLISPDNVHDAFGLVPLFTAELRGIITPHSVGAFVGVLAILAASVSVAVSPRRAWLLAAAVFVYYGFNLWPVDNRIAQASHASIAAGISVRRDWVDHRVGSRAQVALLTYGGTTALPFFENEFFNRSVRKVYTMSGAYDGLPNDAMTPAPSGVLHDSAGNRARARYVLANSQVVPAGRVLARDSGIGMTLYETDGVVRIRSTVAGLYLDRWSGPSVSYTQYGCRGGTLYVHVLPDPKLFHRGLQTLTATMGNTTLAQTAVPTTKPATFVVPMPKNAQTCAVNFLVSPTAVPAQVLGKPDTRTLGIRFMSFSYVPRRR
jgi:hypothetical protein